MSIALMTAVWRLDLSPSDKMVLLALADAANDEGVTWMAVRHRKADDARLDLLTKCSLSERAVQGALKRLCEAGLLSRRDVPGKGVIWTVTPAASAPPQHLRPAGNDANPRSICGETVSNPHTSEANASSVPRAKRKHFVPDGWMPTEAHVLKAQTLGLDLHEQAEAFREFEFDKPKADFDLAFHRWLRTARKFSNDRPSSSNRSGPAYAQPSRAERDQSAALRVLAARGALPGPGEGGRVHDLGPARPAAAGG